MPRRKAEEEEQVAPITYADAAATKFAPVESLTLVASCRGNLPYGDFPAELIFLAVRQPGLYSTFLGKIIAGSSFRAAAMGCALSPNRVIDWLRCGASDLGDGEDTYCSRFLCDCQRAAALAVSDAEERVFRSNPEKWLSKGPAKQFHEGKMWQEVYGQKAIESDSEPEETPFNPIPMREGQPQIEGPEAAEGNEGNEDLEKALKVLEEHQIVQSPEFVKQARAQYNLPESP